MGGIIKEEILLSYYKNDGKFYDFLAIDNLQKTNKKSSNLAASYLDCILDIVICDYV